MGPRWLNLGVGGLACPVCIALAVSAILWQPVWSQEPPPEEAEPAELEPPAPAEEPAELSRPAEEPAERGVEEPGEKPASAPAETPAGARADTTVEDNFAAHLHFARIGSFPEADAHAQVLLKHPDLAPELTDKGADRLVALTTKGDNAVETLILLSDNSAVGENAAKVLTLVREAHRRDRRKPAGIKGNIELLSGTPMQRSVGLERLIASGEYAVPWALRVLADPQQERLHVFVLRALPKLGRNVINPLVEALNVEAPAIQGSVAEVLGEIGYAQALPYLQRLAADDRGNAAVRDAAAKAIKKIVVDNPAAKKAPAHALFHDLAEQYYAGVDSVSPDPREDRANVWFFKNANLEPIEVPADIFPFVMCMRCCEASLALEPEQPGTVALWLAANFRREARLGLDVQSEAPADTLDRTRPAEFPRGLYFARIAGPDICQLALGRAVRDRERDVALGCIAGLSGTAGAAALVEPRSPHGLSLAAALSFPDRLVRIQAGLALGRAMPAAAFRGAEEVVPVLASGLSLTGKKAYLLVDPVEATREAMAEGLRRTDVTVVAADRLEIALTQARKQLTHVDGVFLASDMDSPAVVPAIRELQKDDRFGLAPIVLLVKRGGNVAVDKVKEADRRVGNFFLVSDDAAGLNAGAINQLLARLARTAERFGHQEMTPEQSASLALSAATTLRALAAGRSVLFDVRAAEQALTDAVVNPSQSEELRVAAASVLALLGSPTAQRAIASVCLNPDQPESLRRATFGALAESARRFGAQLEEEKTRVLIEQAVGDPNLVLRTAASQALGAMNLPTPRPAKIILDQPKP